MGNSSSSAHEHDEVDGEDDPLDPFDGIDTLGYRVLGVQPDSPAAAAGLVSFLDFLVGCNGKMLLGSGQDLEPGMEYDDVDLPALLDENKGQEIEFLVWNIKSHEARLVHLTPSDAWGGAGLLGVTIRLDNYAGAEDRLVRVLSVEPHSPAAIAGLIPEHDFLLGTTHQTLDTVDRLAVAVLQQNIDRVVELYVYNSVTDVVRVVALMPTYHWGNDNDTNYRGGLLGAEVGTGYLHRLPAAARATAGSSVERKVRYVKNNDTDDDDDANVHLEVEPQLEMEEEEDSDEVESVALETPEKVAPKTPDNYAARTKTTPEKPAAAVGPASSSSYTPETTRPPVQQPHNNSTSSAPSSTGVPRAPNSAGLDPKEVQAIFQKPPPVMAQPQQHATLPPQQYHQSSPPQQLQQQPYHQASPTPQHFYQATQQQHASTPPQHQHYPGGSPLQQQVASYQAGTEQQLYKTEHVPPPPPAVNPTYTNPTAQPRGANFSYASNNVPSPLGPPPQAYYGSAAATASVYSRPYSNSSSREGGPYQQQQQSYINKQQPTYSSAPLPPPPAVGFRNQQQPYRSNGSAAASLSHPPHQYSASS